MSTQLDPQWVDLLHTAKTIRRSVRPVAPSPGFRRHLRSDLATALGTGRPIPALSRREHGVAPALVLGASLGLTVIALALVLQRSQAARQRER